MGGFLCVLRRPGATLAAIQADCAAALKALRKRGLSLSLILDTPTCIAFVFAKSNFSPPNVVRFDQGDFIFATGTLLYRNKMGAAALAALHRDFSPHSLSFENLQGHYFVCLAKDGKVYAFNDFNGTYFVYRDDKAQVFCSSLVALGKLKGNKTVSEQELFEYISSGAWHGDDTIFNEIKLLDSNLIHQLVPEAQNFTKSISVPRIDTTLGYEEQQDVVLDLLLHQFRIIKDNFGHHICSALTGGYDSRLMAALCRRVDMHPRYYIYGAPNSPDVQVAQAICRGENLPLEHQDKNWFRIGNLDEFLPCLEATFYLLDGQSELGVLDPSELFTRRWRTKWANLQLNAIGGEMYRNRYVLAERQVDIPLLIRQQFDLVNLEWFTPRFQKTRYLCNLGEKLKKIIKTSADRVNRQDLEKAYPIMQLKYETGPIASANNVLSYALMPYLEPVFTLTAAAIPVSYRAGGRFEAALIARLDPSLAKYPSVYGYNFFEPLNGWHRLKDFLMVHFPLSWRTPLLQGIHRLSPQEARPYYLDERYLNAVFGSGPLQVEDYVRLDTVRDPVVLNRALTVELLLRHRF